MMLVKTTILDTQCLTREYDAELYISGNKLWATVVGVRRIRFDRRTGDFCRGEYVWKANDPEYGGASEFELSDDVKLRIIENLLSELRGSDLVNWR